MFYAVILLAICLASASGQNTIQSGSPQTPPLSAPTSSVVEPRERWIKMPEIFRALGLQEGSRVADVGSGPGTFTVPLARAVGKSGRIFAIDIDERALTPLRQRIREAALENVEVIHGNPDDPKLPAGALDAALIVDAYHEMTAYQAMLSHIRRALKPGGRLVIVDRLPQRTRDKSREEQVDKHVIAPELVEKELSQAGFEIIERRDQFIVRPQDDNYFWLITARRPR